MKTLIIVAVSILIFMEILSIGVYFCARKCGVKNAKAAFIPFVTFTVLQKITGTFSVFTIPVKRLCALIAELTAVALLAALCGLWGTSNLPQISKDALWDIMALPIAVCILLFYAVMIKASQTVWRRFRIPKEGLWVLMGMAVVTLPLLYALASKRTPRMLSEMY